MPHRGPCSGRVVHGRPGRRGGIAVDAEEGRAGGGRSDGRRVPVAIEARSKPGGGAGIRQAPVVMLGRPLLYLEILLSVRPPLTAIFDA